MRITPTDIGISSTVAPNWGNSDAFKFNGTNSYIEVKPYAAVNHPAEFTIELWDFKRYVLIYKQTTNNFGSHSLIMKFSIYIQNSPTPWNNLSGYKPFYAVNGLEKWSFTGGSGAWGVY